MTEQMFEIKADHPRRLLRVTLRGFWSIEVMSSYMGEVRSAMRDLQESGGCKHILIDMVDYAIQSKEVAEGHSANLEAVSRAGETRVALVMQNGLSKLQAARVAADTGHRTFQSEEAALDWLLATHSERQSNLA